MIPIGLKLKSIKVAHTAHIPFRKVLPVHVQNPSVKIESRTQTTHATFRGISVTTTNKTLDARQAADPVARVPGLNGGGRIKAFSSRLSRRLSSPATPASQGHNRRRPAPTAVQVTDRSRFTTSNRARRLRSIIFLAFDLRSRLALQQLPRCALASRRI